MGNFFLYQLLKIFLVPVLNFIFFAWIRIRNNFSYPGSGSVSKLYGSATLVILGSTYSTGKMRIRLQEAFGSATPIIVVNCTGRMHAIKRCIIFTSVAAPF